MSGPKVKTRAEQYPPAVRTLNFHGCSMRAPLSAGGDWIGDCPFCGKRGHLYLAEAEGLWDCKVCGESGNQISFLGKVAAALEGKAKDGDWEVLSRHRRIPAEHLKGRHLRWTGSQWLIPMWSEAGTIRDLRRYDMRQLMSTAGCQSQLLGMRELAKAKAGTRVHLCEGEWDAVAMDWLLAELGVEDRVVVAVPGAGIMKDEWLVHFKGKRVVCHYDSDEAGDNGADKAMVKLKGYAKELTFCNWPDTVEDGYDLRDFVADRLWGKGGGELSEAAGKALEELQALHRTAPRRNATAEPSKVEKPEGPPATLVQVLEAFGKRMRMSEDLKLAVTVAIATVVSNDLTGDPLWIYLVGPPGCGKTMVLSALAASERCIFRSTVTPHCLVSGWQGSAGDPSLIPKLVGLTLVAKDFTEVLSMPKPAQDEIFGTLRGAYDGMVQKTFGNGVERLYENCHFSMLAGVTNAIHGHKTASLGERFLKFQIKRQDGAEADALVMAAIGAIGQERQAEEELRTAVTSALRRKLDPAKAPKLGEGHARRLTAIVQLVALLRAAVERDLRTQDLLYRPVPEAGTRLAKQLARLSVSVAALKGEPVVTEETFKVAERVAGDTAHGFYYDIVAAGMRLGGEFTKNSVAQEARVPTSTAWRQLEDLALLGVVEPTGRESAPGRTGGRPVPLLRVAARVAELWAKSQPDGAAPPPKVKSRPITIKRRASA